VEAAAVIGSRVDLTLLAAARGGTDPAADLDDCLATGILVADGAALRFRHELVRMAVEAAIPPHRTAELHARLLAALEQRDGADLALLLTAPRERATRRPCSGTPRRPPAAPPSRCPPRGRAQYERPAVHRRQRPGCGGRLHEGAAEEYGCLDGGRTTSGPAHRLALRREQGDLESAGRILRLLSTTLWRLCRGEESDQAGAEAMTVLETLPPERSWPGPTQTGADHAISGRLDEADAVLRSAASWRSGSARPVSRSMP